MSGHGVRMAPSPIDVFTAGAFFGLMEAANGRTIYDIDEDELPEGTLDLATARVTVYREDSDR